MSQVLTRQDRKHPPETPERTGYRAPVRRPAPVAGFVLVAIGALAALVGVYFQFAPSDWWLADPGEVPYLASYTVGGLTAGAGLMVFADWLHKVDDDISLRMLTTIVLGVVAVALGVMAAVLWIQAPAEATDDVTGADRHLEAQAQAIEARAQAIEDSATDVTGADRHLEAQAQAIEAKARAIEAES